MLRNVKRFIFIEKKLLNYKLFFLIYNYDIFIDKSMLEQHKNTKNYVGIV